MIECIVNGRRAIPSLRDEIKLTRENPFVKSGGSYTYDVIFPMDIIENVRVFGAVHRPDVSKAVRRFGDCALYAGNHLMIRGSGTVTSVNESEVRLQIISESSASAYSEAFDSVYIDRITYMEVAEKYRGNEVADANDRQDRPYYWKRIPVMTELASKGFVGEAGYYIFQTVQIGGESPTGLKSYANAIHKLDGEVIMGHLSVQPSLFYVVRRVLETLGYSADLSAYERKPWNDLYIANATLSTSIARALPHWTAKTLLEEFRKLFNAVFLFDEDAKVVRVVPYSESDNADVVRLEVIDEFESNYDDDGLEYLGASNIEYSFSGNHEEHVTIGRQVINRYPVRDFFTFQELQAWRDSATERELLTTFIRQHEFRTEELYLYYARKLEDDNIAIQPAGIFRPLFRDTDSDTSVSLKMVPVATVKGDYLWWDGRSFLDGEMVISGEPVAIPYTTLPVLDGRPDRIEEDDYVSIYEAIDEGESPDKEETEEEEIIELMFATSPSTYNTVNCVSDIPKLPKAVPDVYLYDSDKVASMSLYKVGGIATIGGFHGGNINASLGRTVDGNNELCFRFPYDGIPDPMKRYNIRNKLYLCSKVEVKVLQDGSIDRIKTGYFYEIL